MPPAPGPRAAAPALAALAVLIVALGITPITNNDLFLHLTTGRMILETGSIPRVDDYSALARGRPFIAHEWLAGVIFRLIERAGGLDALILMKTGVALLVGGLLYLTARRLGAAVEAAVPALACALTIAAARLMERPHIFTFLLTAAYLLVLTRRAGGGGALWILPLLQILWANLHGAFLLGPAIVGLAAAGALLERAPGARAPRTEALRLAALAAGLLAASLINPYGAALLRFPLDLTSSVFMEEIYEWRPPFDSAFASTYVARYYVAWGVAGIGVLLAAGWRAARAGRRSPAPVPLPAGATFHALVFALFLALSLRMHRHVADFALAGAPAVAAAASWLCRRPSPAGGPSAPIGAGGPGPPARARLRGWILPLLTFALLGLAARVALAGYAYGPSLRRPFGLGLGPTLPVAAADYLEANGITGNAFNSYGAGAYLIHRFYPAVRVAMDSRNDVYGADLYAEYARALADAAALEALLGRVEAAFILLDWPRPGAARTAAAIRSLDRWGLVYFDDRAVVYLPRDGAHASVAARDAYVLLDPALFRPATLPPHEARAALAEADRAVRAGGGAYIARLMRIDALLTLGRIEEGLAEDERILAEAPSLHHVYVHLGTMRLRLNDRAAAAARFRKALALVPGSDAARQGLREARAP
jgi:hypothetical protein